MRPNALSVVDIPENSAEVSAALGNPESHLNPWHLFSSIASRELPALLFGSDLGPSLEKDGSDYQVAALLFPGGV